MDDEISTESIRERFAERFQMALRHGMNDLLEFEMEFSNFWDVADLVNKIDQLIEEGRFVRNRPAPRLTVIQGGMSR